MRRRSFLGVLGGGLLVATSQAQPLDAGISSPPTPGPVREEFEAGEFQTTRVSTWDELVNVNSNFALLEDDIEAGTGTVTCNIIGQRYEITNITEQMDVDIAINVDFQQSVSQEIDLGLDQAGGVLGEYVQDVRGCSFRRFNIVNGQDTGVVAGFNIGRITESEFFNCSVRPMDENFECSNGTCAPSAGTVVGQNRAGGLIENVRVGSCSVEGLYRVNTFTGGIAGVNSTPTERPPSNTTINRCVVDGVFIGPDEKFDGNVVGISGVYNGEEMVPDRGGDLKEIYIIESKTAREEDIGSISPSENENYQPVTESINVDTIRDLPPTSKLPGWKPNVFGFPRPETEEFRLVSGLYHSGSANVVNSVGPNGTTGVDVEFNF